MSIKQTPREIHDDDDDILRMESHGLQQCEESNHHIPIPYHSTMPHSQVLLKLFANSKN